LDSPSVGRGYINEPGRTAEVFIDPPAWHRNTRPDATRKLYKTGDLVRYNAEARSIRYVGRKDNQVKLNGQRIELGEVETQIRRLFDGISNVVVELVTLADKPDLQMLMALILAGPQSKIEREILAESKRLTHGDNLRDSGEQWILEPNKVFQAQVQLVRRKLQDVIPGYMVPVVMLPLRSMPFMVSGKTDRERLRSLASRMTWKELEAYMHASTSFDKKDPSTPTERVIQRLWAGVLQIPSGNIGRDDSFLDVGGDSLAAIKLAGAARREGLILTVGHIYGHQTLSEMAEAVSMCGPDVTAASIAPFSLLSGPDDRAAMVKLAVRQCRLRDAEEIEDIYPCTPLQAGLISLTAKRPGAYTVALEYELPGFVDIQGFQSAWAEVVEANPILRTRILQARNGLMYQVVVRAGLLWESSHDQVSDKTEPQDWKMGHPLVRLYISQQVSPTEPLRFILVLHHAVTDGWAITKILEQVDAAYRGKSIQRRQFNDFIEYISRTSHKNNAFWNKSFKDLNAAVFPAVPSLDYVANPTIKKTCVIETAPAAGIFTISNKMKLAWAILLSLYTKSLDVVFGTIVNGRAAALLKIEELTGPTIATIPVRLLLDPDSTIAESLGQVQENFIATIPFEQTGLQNITRAGPEAAAACQFQSLLVVQPEKESLPIMFSKFKDLSELSAFTTYAITLNCQPSYGCVEVEATFDPGVVDEVQLGQMLHQVKHLFEQITPSQRKLRIRDINAVGSHDWSHKVDYKLLRALAAENSKHGTGALTPAKARRKPATDVQRLLHKLFAEVVNIPAVELSADDNFFRMGGDSIVAMNLVTRGREQGLLFTVADIFECPTVISLAEKAQTHAGDPELQIRPFSLIGDGPDLIEIVECALDQCRVERDEIVDIYPTTPLQEGLVALATKNPGTYIARFEYLLPRDIDLKRFQKAWSAVYTANSILRTRIIQSAKYGTLQVVLGKPLQWEIYSSLEEERSCSDSRLMSLGTPLMHMALIPSPEKSNHRFIWTIHHALYDGKDNRAGLFSCRISRHSFSNRVIK
jgi:aryl carrier-like protein